MSWDFQPSLGLIARDIDRLGVDIRSFREPLSRAIKQVIIPSIQQNFAVGGRPGWEPLSEYTVKLRGSAGPILVRSGNLERAATQFNIWDVGMTSATIRSLPANVRYGNVHQAGYGRAGGRKGTKEPGRGQAKVYIPQRQFIMFQPEDIDAVEVIFMEWLAERLAMRGRL